LDAEVRRSHNTHDSSLVGDVQRAAEEYTAAIESYEAALAEETSLDAESRARLRWQLARCYHSIGEYGKAEAALLPLQSLVQDLPSIWAARVLSLSGWVRFYLGDFDRCIERCTAARDLLYPSSEHADLSRALRWLGYAWQWKGKPGLALDCFRDALAAARRSGSREENAKGYKAIGGALHASGQYREALSNYERALEIYAEIGSREMSARVLLQVGITAFRLGEYPRAREALESSDKAIREGSLRQGAPLVAIAFARLHKRLGEWDRARAHAEEALRVSEELSFPRGVALAREELGDLAWLAGDAEGAIPQYRAGMAVAGRIAPEGDLVCELAWRIARALPEKDGRGEAHERAQLAIELAESQGDLRELGNALLVRAKLYSRDGAVAEWRADIERSLNIFHQIRAPYELGRAHCVAADLLGERVEGSSVEVTGHLLEARRLFAKLGARVDRERVEEELRRCERPAAQRRAATVRRRRGRDLVVTASASLITVDPHMRELVEFAKRLAGTNATVILEGETGTGKEILAALIHESGPRAGQPFLAVNCAAISEHLLESELFGHEKGAFTGADREREGILRAARGGTVLLDEIDKASLDFQAKLLRVLDERQVRAVGAVECVPLSARILCATNRNLPGLVERGSFLPDFYYRLSAFRLVVPPLRERAGDVGALATHFLARGSELLNVRPRSLSAEALALLESYAWPGNVRELKNVVESAAFFAREDGIVRPEHLPREIREASAGEYDGSGAAGLPANTFRERVEEFERREIQAALRQAGGVKTEAARILGVSRRGLGTRMRRLGLQ
jgi:DNA-binding NtrC family response regulator/tetratricopeptide (TPR) repeat protein